MTEGGPPTPQPPLVHPPPVEPDALPAPLEQPLAPTVLVQDPVQQYKIQYNQHRYRYNQANPH